MGENLLDEFCKSLIDHKNPKRLSKYDCILGVSGGVDSSILLHELTKRGVRPLCVHFDNTWNSPIATENIYKVMSATGADLITYVADNHEYDDLYKAFLQAGVKDIEAPTDIAFMGALYREAERQKIKVIVEGHSFRTEGVSPLGWLYMDGAYISSVYKRFAGKRLRHFPNLSLYKFLKWTLISKIKRVRPLYWLDYDKRVARTFLAKSFGWKWYGGHHLENRFSAFYHSFFLPKRFGIDFRTIELSALVRTGLESRGNALLELSAPRDFPRVSLAYVKNRLALSDAEFDALMNLPLNTYRSFRTYKPVFEFLRPLFLILMNRGYVPESFYRKFCLK